MLAVVLLAKLLRSGALRRSDGDGHAGTDDPQGGVVVFVLVTAAVTLAGGVWAWAGDPGIPAQIIRVSLGGGAGLAGASLVCRHFVAVRVERP